jgi:hypothetical protein
LLTWASAILAASVGTPVLAQVVVPSVPGTANPYLSGMPNGSTCCGGDSAPAQSPVQVPGLTLAPGSTLTFSVTGSVNFVPGPSGNPPDGGVLATTPANNGISGASWPANALVGVFLDNSLPTAAPTPAGLDFSTAGSRSFTSLSPALKQAFFIGDGLTGNGIGAVQTFVVPAGATRLFLGTSDGTGWFNNSGSFAVTVTATAPPPTPTLSINSVSNAEGNSGTTPLTFTVTLSAASGQTVTVNFATADSSATAGSDYTAVSGTLTFVPGTTSQPIVVNVIGDTAVEPSETFLVTLSNPTNATLALAQGTGTIVNDDIVVSPSVEPIPTVGEWTLAALASLLAALGMAALRRREARGR